MQPPLITVENLSKSFRIAKRQPGLWGAVRGVVHREYHTIAALDAISFSVQAGELIGYIGPNGAGKSTTVKILSGILVPDSGSCKVLGRTPWKHRIATVQKIGVVFGQRTQLWWDLPVLDSFELLRDIYRVPHARLQLQYRAAALAGFATQLFWGLIRVMIFAAFYRASTSRQPMSYQEVVSYIWLGQAMLMIIPWNVNRDIRDLIRTGGVAFELLRPLDLYIFWYCRILAGRTAPTLLRAVPMLIIATLFLGLRLPNSWDAAAAWMLTTIAAIFLSCAITAVVTISLMWTISGEGVTQISMSIIMLFSGLVIPLPLFPDWLQPAIAFLPFRGLGDVPFRAYIGHISPEQVLPAFAHQLIWIFVLILLGRWLLVRGLKKLVIQGG